MGRHFNPFHSAVPEGRAPVHCVATGGVKAGRPTQGEATAAAIDPSRVHPGSV